MATNRDGDILNDDMAIAKLKLPVHVAGRERMSLTGKYAKATRSVDGAPIGESTYIIPSRTLPPATAIAFGADKRPIGHVEHPDMIESQPVQNYGLHRPIFRGWRPKREETSYPDLGIELMSPERNYKLETSIPSEREMVVESIRNAVSTYPAVSGDEGKIPDPYRFYGMHVEKSEEGMNGYMGDLGADPVPPKDPSIEDAIKSVAQSVAAGIRAKYGGQQGIAPPAPAPSTAPWGTIATVAVIGLAAVFILPKILK